MVSYSPGLGLSCARAQACGHELLTHCESLCDDCRFEREIQARRFLVSPRPQSRKLAGRLGGRSSRKFFAAPPPGSVALPPGPIRRSDLRSKLDTRPPARSRARSPSPRAADDPNSQGCRPQRIAARVRLEPKRAASHRTLLRSPAEQRMHSKRAGGSPMGGATDSHGTRGELERRFYYNSNNKNRLASRTTHPTAWVP